MRPAGRADIVRSASGGYRNAIAIARRNNAWNIQLIRNISNEIRVVISIATIL